MLPRNLHFAALLANGWCLMECEANYQQLILEESLDDSTLTCFLSSVFCFLMFCFLSSVFCLCFLFTIFCFLFVFSVSLLRNVKPAVILEESLDDSTLTCFLSRSYLLPREFDHSTLSWLLPTFSGFPQTPDYNFRFNAHLRVSLKWQNQPKIGDQNCTQDWHVENCTEDWYAAGAHRISLQ